MEIPSTVYAGTESVVVYWLPEGVKVMAELLMVFPFTISKRFAVGVENPLSLMVTVMLG